MLSYDRQTKPGLVALYDRSSKEPLWCEIAAVSFLLPNEQCQSTEGTALTPKVSSESVNSYVCYCGN